MDDRFFIGHQWKHSGSQGPLALSAKRIQQAVMEQPASHVNHKYLVTKKLKMKKKKKFLSCKARGLLKFQLSVFSGQC